MKIDKDGIIYLILFTLISLEAYKDNAFKNILEKRINSLEDICWKLTAERAKTNNRLDRLEFKNDSLYTLYLHSNK
jgi:hypothetical protein